jgi:hypothetical protein
LDDETSISISIKDTNNPTADHGIEWQRQHCGEEGLLLLPLGMFLCCTCCSRLGEEGEQALLQQQQQSKAKQQVRKQFQPQDSQHLSHSSEFGSLWFKGV